MIFEEEFPSLDKDDTILVRLGVAMIYKDDVKRFCLDKKRVKEAIDLITLQEGNKGNISKELKNLGVNHPKDITMELMSQAIKNILLKRLGL